MSPDDREYQRLIVCALFCAYKKAATPTERRIDLLCGPGQGKTLIMLMFGLLVTEDEPGTERVPAVEAKLATATQPETDAVSEKRAMPGTMVYILCLTR